MITGTGVKWSSSTGQTMSAVTRSLLPSPSPSGARTHTDWRMAFVNEYTGSVSPARST